MAIHKDQDKLDLVILLLQDKDEEFKARLEAFRDAKAEADEATAKARIARSEAEAEIAEAKAQMAELDKRAEEISNSWALSQERETRTDQLLKEAEEKFGRAKRDEARAKMAREQLARAHAELLNDEEK